MTIHFYNELRAAAGLDKPKPSDVLVSYGNWPGYAFFTVGPFLAGAMLFWMMAQDPNAYSYTDVHRLGVSAYGNRDYWSLLTPIVVIEVVLAVALLPFMSDLAALRQVARRSHVFAFALSSMVMAAAIYAHLPIYLIAVLAFALNYVYTRISRSAAEAVARSGLTYWFVSVLGQLVVLWLTLKVVMGLDYTQQDLDAGGEFVLHGDALLRFAVFGVLAVLGAYLMALCNLVRFAAVQHGRFAKNVARAWLVANGIATTPANIAETIKQKADEIERALDAALEEAGYPAGFWRKHHALLSVPVYAVLFVVVTGVSWFLGGLGIALLLPAEATVCLNEKAYGVQAAVKAQPAKKNNEGHTIG